MCSIVWAYSKEIVNDIPLWISKEIPEFYDGNLFDEAAIFDLRNKKIATMYKIRSHDDLVYKIVFNFLSDFKDYWMNEFACYCPSPRRDIFVSCLCEIKFVEMTIRQICHDALCKCDDLKERFQALFKIPFAIYCDGKKLCRLETCPGMHYYERCPCFNLVSCRWFDGYPLLCRIQNYLNPCPETDSDEEEVIDVEHNSPSFLAVRSPTSSPFSPQTSPIHSPASDDTLPIFDTAFVDSPPGDIPPGDENQNTQPDIHCYEVLYTR